MFEFIKDVDMYFYCLRNHFYLCVCVCVLVSCAQVSAEVTDGCWVPESLKLKFQALVSHLLWCPELKTGLLQGHNHS